MFGSEIDGTMADSDNEGNPGWTIGSVHGAWAKSKWMKPNLVLISAGFNSGGDHSKAGERTKSLVDDIFNSVPGGTVVLSTLPLNKDSSRNSCSDDISKQIRKLAAGYKGARIALAGVRSIRSMDDIGPHKDHPTDDGYKMFAGVWWDAISKIKYQIQPPAKVDNIDDAAGGSSNQCKKVAGNAGLPGQSQMGSGHDDGNYVHKSTSKCVTESAKIDKGSDPKSITDAIPSHIFFANIVKGDPNAERTASLDDWIRVYNNTKDKNAYWFRQNLGGGKFDKSVQFNVDIDCDLGARYAFADFFDQNNDGLDDFFCIKENAVWVSLNRGGNSPKFESIGQVSGGFDGLKGTDVRIADIDGGGKADFCLVKSAGEIACSRNGGSCDKPQWQGFSTAKGIRGTVFNTAQPDKAGIILGIGSGSGIVPKWRSAGQTHAGQAESGIQDSIKFGRIYGSNCLDYIFLKEEKDHFDVVVWQNQGAGGTKLKADGNFYCDMRGSGSDDYVWIYQDGHAAEINVNIHSPPAWGHNTEIALTVPGPRNSIYLANYAGNRKCNGVGISDLGMRFYDVDGDGRADAFCIEKNGRITGWLNKADGLENVGQIKFSEAWDRSNIRFADVKASGRADLLRVDKYTGAVDVFTNNGHKAQGGSSFSWTNCGMLYNPIDRSENMTILVYQRQAGGSVGDDIPIIDLPGFYMDFQIANLFNAFKSIWMDNVENAIEQLSSGIKTIVKEHSTPPHEENGDFLNMLVGILTSPAGFGAERALFTGTMTYLAGIFASMSAGSSWETTVSPETLNEELEMAYGDMFRKVMNSTKTFVPFIFSGSLPKGWTEKQMTKYYFIPPTKSFQVLRLLVMSRI
ncbi:acetylxylan esterase [Fusarium mundagurra]|uniref:Acetylxylan esterase n=1 Tax=Fusarium mundagurra TaxID=1567541 RepID=A0A8H6DCM8_9HYPO|nr:acetylxylan esterase [Fusarium mundagurra]